jgi:hypothetical protein
VELGLRDELRAWWDIDDALRALADAGQSALDVADRWAVAATLPADDRMVLDLAGACVEVVAACVQTAEAL